MLQLETTISRTGSLSEAVRDQLPFALSRAINHTLLDMQFAGRLHLRQRFTIRRLSFAERSVKIRREDFSTKHNLVGRVGLQGPRADVFAQHELGGIKRPSAGGRSIAIPIDPRRSKSDVIQRGQRPRAIIDSGRAFIATRGGGRMILQRVGRGKQKTLRPLYLLKPSVRLPDRMDFLPALEQTARSRFGPNLEAAIRGALRTARPR